MHSNTAGNIRWPISCKTSQITLKLFSSLVLEHISLLWQTFTALDLPQNSFFKATKNIESTSINQLANIKITKHPKYSFEAVLPKLSRGQQVVLPLLQVLELEIKTWADHATLKENSSHTQVHPLQNVSRNSNNVPILKTWSVKVQQHENTVPTITSFQVGGKENRLVPCSACLWDWRRFFRLCDRQWSQTHQCNLCGKAGSLTEMLQIVHLNLALIRTCLFEFSIWSTERQILTVLHHDS